ncbi:hypothetical protein PISMIDRAFT_690906 [Pisolithus microcarpus 441]|uniref:Uncharacterized protein n=1 Tax=Pisolithus microcarpus 441 TaxID=765257 RepID=A0A0C9Y0C1_9AGAM|nr:hypothetical protein PISMIDRAFT_690906 [Pisolithus microcarpus 441]
MNLEYLQPNREKISRQLTGLQECFPFYCRRPKSKSDLFIVCDFVKHIVDCIVTYRAARSG